MSPTKFAIAMIERGLVPDTITRMAIRRLLAERLKGEAARAEERQAWIASLDKGPIAIDTERSKEQHYELPPAYFETVLGPHLKYSSCLWEGGTETLEEAERAMLALTCARALLEDGQSVLELGCGWGSLSLWMAEQYPRSRITAVSHSAPQRRHIEARAKERGLGNLQVITADMRDFAITERFHPGGVGGNVRAYAQLQGAHAPHRHLARARWQALRPYLHPSRARLSLRG